MATYCRLFGGLLLKMLLVFSCFYGVTPKRTKEKIYIDITSQNGCFRLLNATHQIGCNSDQEGNTGVIHYMQTQEDWNHVLRDGSTAPYVPVLDTVNFTSANVRSLVRSGRVTGIAVLSVNITIDALAGFSVDKSCPNDAYGLYHGKEDADCKRVVWNQAGDGLFFDDLNVPIFSITEQSDVDTIINQCWEPFNKPLADGKSRTYPLCAMQLKSAMTAAKDTETCIRRSNLVTNLNPFVFCDPMGDKNIVATLKAVPSNETRPDKSVVVVATRMDSMGLFFNEFPSSDTTVTGIVALLATAQALWKKQDEILKQPDSKDIMFTFLQGEAFDYIGSSRMLYEMKKGRFPVNFENTDGGLNLQKIQLSHVAQFVELSQVGMRQDEDSLWLHVHPSARSATQPFLDQLTKLGNETSTSFLYPDLTVPLPPASLQRFLMEAGNDSFPSFVITDHKNSYTNRFYNSHLDLPSQIGADYPSGTNDTDNYNTATVQSQRITNLATALARYLYITATGGNDTQDLTDIEANITEVNHMLYCFLHNPRCELFNITVSPDNADALNQNTKPFPFYVTISSTTNQVTILTQGVLAYYTGQIVANVPTEDKCAVVNNDKRYNYLWMQGPVSSPSGERTPVCYKSTVLLSKAESPAFDIDDYDYKSGQYSTWTESRWDVFTVRVFLIPSKQLQTQTLSVGVILLLLSLVLVYWVNSKSDVIFRTRGTSREYLFNVRT